MAKLTEPCDWLRRQKHDRIILEAFRSWIAMQLARTQNTPDSERGES